MAFTEFNTKIFSGYESKEAGIMIAKDEKEFDKINELINKNPYVKFTPKVSPNFEDNYYLFVFAGKCSNERTKINLKEVDRNKEEPPFPEITTGERHDNVIIEIEILHLSPSAETWLPPKMMWEGMVNEKTVEAVEKDLAKLNNPYSPWKMEVLPKSKYFQVPLQKNTMFSMIEHRTYIFSKNAIKP
jgi:hypothetical protein